MAVTQACQSVTQVQRSHKQWLEWLDDSRPAARSDLFGGYTKNMCELTVSTLSTSGAIYNYFNFNILHVRQTNINLQNEKLIPNFYFFVYLV